MIDMLSIAYETACNTFIQVGTFVAITLLIFGYLDYKTHGGLIEGFVKYKKLQVVIGTFLGFTPGCGGALLVIPLYLKGQVTFGTIIGTFIGTMGDAAFVILISMPREFLAMGGISFVVGCIFGYLTDYLKIGATLITDPYTDETLQKNTIFQEELSCVESTSEQCAPSIVYHFRHKIGYILIWIFSVLTFPLGIMNLLQIDYDHLLPIKNLGAIGACGTLFCIVYTLICKKFIADDSLAETQSKNQSFKESLIHNAEDTAFVVMWVFFALLIYNTFVILIGGEDVLKQLLQQQGYWAIIVALLVGLIPGCGPHIILATLYVQGLIPFSAMITNAICNDGDALFPLLAMHRKAALVSSLYGMIPALLVGTILYMLGY